MVYLAHWKLKLKSSALHYGIPHSTLVHWHSSVHFRNTNIKPSNYKSASSCFIKGAQYNNVIAMNMTVEQFWDSTVSF